MAMMSLSWNSIRLLYRLNREKKRRNKHYSLQMHRCKCISINNYVAEKWLLQPFLADPIDFDNASPRKLQSPENILHKL